MKIKQTKPIVHVQAPSIPKDYSVYSVLAPESAVQVQLGASEYHVKLAKGESLKVYHTGEIELIHRLHPDY